MAALCLPKCPFPIRARVASTSKRAAPFQASRRPAVTVQASAPASNKELASEFTGATVLQLIGGAAPAALAAPANGLALGAMIFTFGATSGAHFNPAISLMMLLRGKISSAKALAYMAAQVAGCVLGALICCWLFPGVYTGMGLGAPGAFGPASSLSGSALFGLEALGTAVLGLTVYGSGGAPLGVAAALMATIMTVGPWTGAVINPARALGPAIVFGLSLTTVGLYVAAQLAGGALAAVLAGAIHDA